MHLFSLASLKRSRFLSCFTEGEIKAGDFPKVPQEVRERAGGSSRTLCLFIALGMRSYFKPRPLGSLRGGSADFHFVRFIGLLVYRRTLTVQKDGEKMRKRVVTKTWAISTISASHPPSCPPVDVQPQPCFTCGNTYLDTSL